MEADVSVVTVQELKRQTSQILRRVWEDGEVIEISSRGKTVARLAPADPQPLEKGRMEDVLANLRQLSADISSQWPEGVSALEAVHDVRRDL
jgi:prevent-host-death family protein